MATIRERYDSRESTEGIESPSVDLIYIVEGTEDDAAVRTLVEATIPALYAGLLFQTYHITHEGGGVWEVTVRYGKKESKDTGESSFSFDTGGVTAHITQSLATDQPLRRIRHRAGLPGCDRRHERFGRRDRHHGPRLQLHRNALPGYVRSDRRVQSGAVSTHRQSE